MAKLVEEKAGEESRRRAARDIISSAIRTGMEIMLTLYKYYLYHVPSHLDIVSFTVTFEIE